MKKRSYRLIKLFLLFALSIVSIVACSQHIHQVENTTTELSSECRVVQHTLGETCVPLNPERIIALDPHTTLDPLIALDVKPIGYASYGSPDEESLLGVSFDKVAGIENVGGFFDPSLEKILALKPDLILNTDYSGDEQKYELLSRIASTVSVPNESHSSSKELEEVPYFKENLRYVAQLIGQESRADTVLSQYQSRVEELREQLGNQLQGKEISVIFYGDGYIWTIAKGVYPISHILDDIGLRYKFVPHGDWNLSVETISEYDSDILFIVDVEKRGPNFYLENPIFSNLEVVKSGRGYVVSQEDWRTVGISGANKILDDLFEHLPEAAQNLSTARDS